ncbi:MAG: hypothetical protein JSS79_19085 [Bacteroidetes bacterium]|nr:hypothetical protein [Bacteroidota bacterium]
MKRIFLVLAVCISTVANASPDPLLLRIKISKPYCVFNFLETCKGVNGTSDALRLYIEQQTKSDTAFQHLIADYIALPLDNLYQHPGFPESRPSYRSIKDLLIIAAVQANTIDDFKRNAIGILHSTDYDKLIQLMTRAAVWYDKIIWSKHGAAAQHQLEQLQKYQKTANTAFIQLKKFYHSSWPEDIPFTIAITPVPGTTNATAATPHANTLCLDVLTEETNYTGRIAIAVHEISHVLFAEQSRQVQATLENLFAQSKSPFAAAAHNFFDEGLATACGNGWMFKQLSGTIDTTGWYSDPYIDGFGHALFPLVSQYINDGKTIDASFVEKAIRLFGEKFPHAPYDYGIQFNHLTMHADESEPVARNTIKQNLLQQFSLGWLNFTTPLLESESVSLLQESPGTHLVLVDRDEEKTFTELTRLFPLLKNITYSLKENFVITFYDDRNRLIVIGKIEKGASDKLFKVLKQKQFVDKAEHYWRF